MSNVFRVVARLGVAAKAAMAGLITGEIGWDTDTKTMRVGDDTNDPTKIASSKSTGEIEYSNQFTPVFANVKIKPNGKVAGIPLGKLNASPGLPIRGDDEDSWRTRGLEGETEYIVVDIPDSMEEGPIVIRASELLKSKLQSSGLRYFYGNVPPENPRPGDIWFSEQDEVVYLRVGANDNEADHIWLDFSSFGGGGGGIRFFSSNDAPPQTASVGDEWYDKAEDRLYKFLNNNDNLIWVEQV